MFGWHDSPWMWLSMLVFWLVIGVLILYAIRGSTDRAARGGPRAIEILEQRYARGELTAEELRERREELSGR